MTYPNPSEQNITTLFDLVKYANNVTNNYLGIGIVILTFIISFISMKVWPTAKAFAASMFITAILTVFLRILGLVGDWIMIIVLLGLCGSIIALYLSENY